MLKFDLKKLILAFGVLLFGLAAVPSNVWMNLTKRPLAIVRRFKPEVDVINRNVNKNRKAQKAEQLFDGDTLATGSDGYAAVQFMDNSLAKIKPNSMLVVNGQVDNSNKSTATRIVLDAGEIFLNVTPRSRSDFDVATPSSVASVKGTKFGTSVGSDGESYIWVSEGEVVVTAAKTGESVSITPGMYGQVNSEGTVITTGKMKKSKMKDREDEFNQMDSKMKPKKLRLKFRDKNGQLHQINLDYYDND